MPGAVLLNHDSLFGIGSGFGVRLRSATVVGLGHVGGDFSEVDLSPRNVNGLLSSSRVSTRASP